jgi:hypothetical protein
MVYLAGGAAAEWSFYLIDNFESGDAGKWYKFSNLQMELAKNPSLEVKDAVAESCGEYALKLKGRAQHWYAGGIGADLGIDAASFSRFQVDVYGVAGSGKLKVELFDDDNQNSVLEQDPARDWIATRDDKWVAEVPVLGKGFTRISIPFTAFILENPGAGDGLWNPDQKDGSVGLLKIQIILLTGSEEGETEVNIDNLLLSY